VTLDKLISRISFTNLFGDRPFFTDLLHFTLPMMAQNLIMSSLNMVGVVLIGQLGETSLAAVGLANQVFFLLQLLMFGITSGAAIFTAQLWGKRNISSIRKVLGLALLLGGTAGIVFALASSLFPQKILGIYTEDQEVIKLGADYLRVFAPGYFIVSMTFCYAAVLRSVGEVRMPVIVSTSALGLNMVLSYWFIFGGIGVPELGVVGAAWAGLISRGVECGLLLGLTYLKKLPPAASLREMFSFNLAFAMAVLKPVLPVALNEFLWSMGITTYNVIYARIGTEAIATMNIAASVDNIAMVSFFATAGACAILLGNLIGADEYDKAQKYAVWCLRLVLVFGVLIGGILFMVSPAILGLYKVSPGVISDARQVLVFISFLIWLRASNALLFVGILRSGGDTRFALLLDGGIIWLIGVPFGAIAAFVFHLPVYYVYLAVMSEELCKFGMAIWRFKSRKWIHNLAQTV
jgi:putative MATE family efflux protein